MRLFLTSIVVILLMAGCRGAESPSSKITCPEDLKGKTVMVMTGSAQELAAIERFPDSEIMQMVSEPDIYYSVHAGKADAGIVSSLSWIQARNEFPDLKCLTDTIKRIPCSAIFKKGSSDLREKFNAFLEQYVSSGEFQESYDEWSQPNSTREMPVFDPSKRRNGTLTIATNPTLPPFTLVKDNEAAGIEAELLARFAESIGMNAKFEIMEWTGVIAAIASGKCDIGFDCICITEERERQVDFGNPYVFEASAVIVRDENAAVSMNGIWTEIKDSFVRNIIVEDRYQLLLDGLWQTLIIVFFSAIFGTVFGIILCFLYMHKNRFLRGTAGLYIDFMRCMPQMVLLMIMFYIVFGKSDISGTTVAIIAFTLCFGAYTGVIFKSAVSSIDSGQSEAALSMGFTKVQGFFHIILPQAVQNALPVYKNEFVGLIKATSIVGYIAVFDLTKASDIIRSRTYEPFFPLIIITVIYFLIIWVLSFALRYAEFKTKPKRKKF